MKKTFIFGLIAASLGFTACSSEGDEILGENTVKKGMVLNATVEQPIETRATIDNSAATWKFAFANNDKISVTNLAVTAGTYYKFTCDGTQFTSTDAETTTSPVLWYAYYPSANISLDDQHGSLGETTKYYALAGKTGSSTTGEGGLDITMKPKVAILKIVNNKGSIDINVKTSASTWVKGLSANNDGFSVTTSTSKVTLLNAVSSGIYYVAVPAEVQISVKDGDNTLKSTGTSGLKPGRYYEVTVTTPDPLLSGDFSVSGSKKVKFTKSNLYWSGSESACHFEADPTKFPTTYDANHIGHFYWSKVFSTSVEKVYSDDSRTASDKIWCDEATKITVDGVEGLYILTSEEWKYLLRERSGAASKYKRGVTVGGVEHCLVIAPDSFTGTISSSYTLADLNAAGLVCLPPASVRYDAEIRSPVCQYWTATMYYEKDYAYFLFSSPYLEYALNPQASAYRYKGCAIRLVK